MGENFQKSALPTFLQIVRVRTAHQPHVEQLKSIYNGSHRKIIVNFPMSITLPTADFKKSGKIYYRYCYLKNQILGICPGDKVPTAVDPLLCACRQDSIELLDHRCAMCTIGEEVPNEDQSKCVGKLDRNNYIILGQCVLMLDS